MSTKTSMIQELRDKTGMAWATAARLVVASAETAANDGAARVKGPLGALLAALQATSTFAVQVGKVRAWGFASDEAGGAVLEMREAQIKPEWWAESGVAFRRITAREFQLLIAAGAADVREVHVLRTRAYHGGVGWSEACDECSRFVCCGVGEREGTCFCGRRHRVVFDRGEMSFSRPRGRRCTSCGTSVNQGDEARALNEWQPYCAACAAGPDEIL